MIPTFMLHIPEHAVKQQVLSILKIYPKKIRLTVYKKPQSVLLDGWEAETRQPKKAKGSSDPKHLIDSLRRTKRLISDIVLCNEFDLFITFTFAKDRENVVKLKKQLTKWIANQKAIHGEFDYILVPEFHKDGKSIHFHGLFKSYRGQLVPAKVNISNRPTYNIKSYRLGFSTAVVIDDHDKVSSYVRKYITKDMPIIKGKKRFWTSKGLQRPKIIHNPDFSTYTDVNLQQIYDDDLLTIYDAQVTV